MLLNRDHQTFFMEGHFADILKTHEPKQVGSNRQQRRRLCNIIHKIGELRKKEKRSLPLLLSQIMLFAITLIESK